MKPDHLRYIFLDLNGDYAKESLYLSMQRRFLAAGYTIDQSELLPEHFVVILFFFALHLIPSGLQDLDEV